MKIAVNTRLLLKNKLEGIGWFTFETLKRITEQHPEHEFYFIFDRKYDESFIFSKNVKPIIIPPQARHPFLFFLWFEFSIPYILKRLKADIFLSTDGYLSLSSKAKQVAVIHDLNFEHNPNDVPFLVRKYFKFFFHRWAKKATRIVTVSEYSKKDIVECYNIDPAKIDIAYNGANEIFVPINEKEKTKIFNRYGNASPFFVFVGALHPRKNIKNLLIAFDIFKGRTDNEIKLLIVGEKQWWTDDIEAAYENMDYKRDVIFTGRLKIAELAKVVASAQAMVYVSYFEGFGIPIIEAFNAGTPVITSNVTSMPEVAGGAALLVDPFNPADISEAMVKISLDENLRNSLISKGLKRGQDFSWQKTADALWASVVKCF
jgi:glycosyltransferase involved in cell wall biosynthesis